MSSCCYCQVLIYNVFMPQKPKYKLHHLDSDNNVGKNMATIRKSHGLSQNDLANKIGITQSLLSSYETGRLSVPIEIVIQVSKALKIDSNEILGLSKEKNNNILADLKITNRMRKIQKLPSNKRKPLFEMIDAYLNANE
jgi:transcriptional regulator with XRE-family HTH domain